MTNWVITPELGTEYVCPSLSLNQIEVSFYIVWLLPGIPPWSKALGFLPPGLRLTKYEDSVSPSSHCHFQLRIMLKSAPSFRFPGCAVPGHRITISTMMEKSISLEPLGICLPVCLSGFQETHRKVVYPLSLLSSLRGYLPACDFLLKWTYKHTWRLCPVLGGTWVPVAVTFLRSTLNLLECSCSGLTSL